MTNFQAPKKKAFPFTPSFEDDLCEIDRMEERGLIKGTLGSYFAKERIRYLHSFAIYRWYRAFLRSWKNIPQEPVVFGEIKSQGRGYRTHAELPAGCERES